ncbi:uncharacterized protein LOC112568674 isoform X3 [Pomacea canaliculata]|uniref:uncharacterized protein LOC112568674 isoform X3 n=2 Tax=Pomacea canaliculata TaxID=400727 RepID=UPI000D72C1DA|nr:uncharacterized protein LOC112568674 isoform X3 [Pomacea canaliculata]
MLRFFIFLLSLSPFVSMEGTESCKGVECQAKTWHNVGCSTDDDCDQPYTTCYKRVCRCHPGYFYTTEDTCTDTCSPADMQDSFTDYPDSALRANLIGSPDRLTVEDCKDRCQTNKRCLTFDFKASGGQCRLHNVTAHERPSDWYPKTSKGWTHYQKSCNSTFASNDTWYNLLCNNRIDCHHPHSDCLSGRCLCHSGFHFNQAQKECVITRKCAHLVATGAKSGVYTIQLPYSNRPVSVWCDMDTTTGGWTVFQRRRLTVYNPDEFADFNRNWTEYVNGFGNISGEFWLGLDAIRALSWYGDNTILRVDLVDWIGTHHWAEYYSFYLMGPDKDYKLYTWYYSGTAGDALKVNSGNPFRTSDHNQYHCGLTIDDGWWYPSACDDSFNDLNSFYKEGMTWADISRLQFSEMKIKPWN